MMEYRKEFQLDLPKDIHDKVEYYLNNKNNLLTKEVEVKFRAQAIRTRKENIAARLKKQEELKIKINKWRKGRQIYFYSNEIPYQLLRINDDEIETSSNATVSIKAAKLLYQMIKKGMPVHGHQIGNYTVNGYANDILKIGCHSIHKDEIELLAVQNNWN